MNKINYRGAVDLIITGASTFILAKIAVFMLLFVGVFGFTLYKGYNNLADLSRTFNVHETHYIISAVNCKELVHGSDFHAIYTKKEPSYMTLGYTYCPSYDEDLTANIIREHHVQASGANYSNYLAYVAVFFGYILLVLSTLYNSLLSFIGAKLSRFVVVVLWLVLSVLMYPFTFMAEKTVTNVSVDGINYSVTSVIVSNDRTEYIPASSDIFDKMRSATTNSPRDISRM